MKALNLDPRNIDLATALAAFMAYTGAIAWIWNVRAIAVSARDDLAALIEERERDKVTWGRRLTEAEKTHASMDRLSDAVQAGAKLTTLQIETLAEKMAAHADATKEQLIEIRREQQAVRQALSARSGGTK